jgi:hypothetical protein
MFFAVIVKKVKIENPISKSLSEKRNRKSYHLVSGGKSVA